MAITLATTTVAIFLMATLSASHIASAFCPGLGVCHSGGYLPRKSDNFKKSNNTDYCKDDKKYP